MFPHLDSTNSLVLSLADKQEHDGVVVLAREQSAGRGQYGRSWQAPPGSSVLLSALLIPPPHVCRPVVLTAWAAVSVSAAVAGLARCQAVIKWPNDVYLDGRKICGILIEQRSAGLANGESAVAVGIGLNVRQPLEFFEQAELPLGGSLLTQTGHDLNVDDTARQLIVQLDEMYQPLLEGEFGALEDQWRQRLGLLGRTVRLETTQTQHVGRLRELTFDGVIVEIAGAAPLLLAPESIRHIKAI